MCNKILDGKVAVVTGAGGVLCSAFASALAKAGAKVALLDLNEAAAVEAAEAICAEGGIAKGYKANVLEKECLEELRQRIHADLGKCDILINGAGGNSPRCTTAHEYYEKGDELYKRRDLMAISMCVMLPVSCVSAIRYGMSGMLDTQYIQKIILPTVIGGILGGVLLDRLKESVIMKLFAFLVIYSGLAMIVR